MNMKRIVFGKKQHSLGFHIFLIFFLISLVAPSNGGAAADIPAAYETLSAKEKFNLLTSLQEETKYARLPEWSGLEPFSLFALALPFRGDSRAAYMGITVNRKSDFMPEGRSKPIHTYGSTAGIRLVVEKQLGYSGIFASGAEYGLIRMSLAAKPSKTLVIPGIALKFLVDGQPSVNLEAMNSLDGQASYNFFENAFSNIISEPNGMALKLLVPVFKAVSDTPFTLGLKHMAAVDASGKFTYPLTKIAFPKQIYFIPTGKLRFDNSPHEVREDLNSIPVGAKLYNVWVDCKDGTKEYLGYIESTTPFVSSSFGDQRLFFNHQRVEEDR